MGRFTLTELAYLLVTRREPTAGRAAGPRRGARVARRPRPHAERARGAAHLHGRARGDPGRDRGGSAGRGQRVPRPRRRHRAVPRSTHRAPTGDDPATSRCELPRLAVEERAGTRAERVPGLGHPVHRVAGSRAPRASTRLRPSRTCSVPISGCCGTSRWPRSSRRAGTSRSTAPAPRGAALVDIGLPPSSVRGFVLIARTAGLVAHLVEEAETPIGLPLWLEVEERAAHSLD